MKKIMAFLLMFSLIAGSTSFSQAEAPPPIVSGNEYVTTVNLPTTGDYYQTSLDGVVWSPWQRKVGLTAQVTLPSGDGKKAVHVRSGQSKYLEIPVTDPTSSSGFSYQKTDEIEVDVLETLAPQERTIDLTAPKVSIRTLSNSLIALNGEITFLVDIVDNITKTPFVKIEILAKGNPTPLFSKEGRLTAGMTTMQLPFSNIPESRDAKGKLQAYTIRMTAIDEKSNRTVQHLSFYVKNKN